MIMCKMSKTDDYGELYFLRYIRIYINFNSHQSRITPELDEGVWGGRADRRFIVNLG